MKCFPVYFLLGIMLRQWKWKLKFSKGNQLLGIVLSYKYLKMSRAGIFYIDVKDMN